MKKQTERADRQKNKKNKKKNKWTKLRNSLESNQEPTNSLINHKSKPFNNQQIKSPKQLSVHISRLCFLTSSTITNKNPNFEETKKPSFSLYSYQNKLIINIFTKKKKTHFLKNPEGKNS